MVIAANLAVRILASVMHVPPECISLMLPMMPPPVLSMAQAEHRAEIDLVLSQFWGKLDGFEIPEEDVFAVDEAYCKVSIDAPVPKGIAINDRKRPSTYGEITALGARQLFGYMGMYDRSVLFSNNVPNDDDSNGKDKLSFYDLGSGTGRLIVQSYMELPRLGQAVGIEMAPSRHNLAVEAWGRLRNGKAERIRSAGLEAHNHSDEEPEKHKCLVRLQKGDLFSLDVSEATHIYVSSLCFNDRMMEKLAEKLQKEARALQCCATLREFPSGLSFFGGQSHLPPSMEWVEMTWTVARGEGCPVYFYHKPPKL